MTPMETSKLLDKVQAFRQSFLITKLVLEEWNRILGSYDYDDVDKKLNEFFKDGNNYGKFPEAYQLIKDLIKIEDKGKVIDYTVYCPYCRKPLSVLQFNKHARRCSSVTYLYDKSKKYLDRTLDKEKLYKISDDEFDKSYNEVCKKLLEKMPDCMDKRLIEEYFEHITNVDEFGHYIGEVKKMNFTSEEEEMMLD